MQIQLLLDPQHNLDDLTLSFRTNRHQPKQSMYKRTDRQNTESTFCPIKKYPKNIRKFEFQKCKTEISNCTE